MHPLYRSVDMDVLFGNMHRLLCLNMHEGYTPNEETKLYELRLTEHLNWVLKIWNRQAEAAYLEKYGADDRGDDPPEIPPDTTSGPVPK